MTYLSDCDDAASRSTVRFPALNTSSVGRSTSSTDLDAQCTACMETNMQFIQGKITLALFHTCRL